MVESGQARSKRDAGDIILDETVDVDDGGGIAELDAGHQYENQGQHRVQGLQHLSLPRLLLGHLIDWISYPCPSRVFEIKK